jgi:hypothetical protein
MSAAPPARALPSRPGTQELAVVGHHDPVALRVGARLDAHRE